MANDGTGKTGVEFWNAGGCRPGEAGPIAGRLESEGFDGLTFGDTECINADPYVGLTAAAKATSRVKLGVGVTNPLTRHPAVTACAIASVHAESDGRAVLGIGRGDSAVAKLGMRAATVKQLEGYLARVQGYLSCDAVDIDGHRSGLQWLAALGLPKVPVDVAATGPAVIALGARLAERVTFNVGADRARLSRAVTLARQARHEAGGPQEGLSLGAYLNIAPHPDRQVARDLVRGVVATYARFSAMPGHPVDQLDPTDASVIEALGENYDMSRHARSDAAHVALLDDDFVDRFAIAGPPEHCVERLVGLFHLGLDRIAMVGPVHHDAAELVAESRQLLINVVLPEARKAIGVKR
jgi:5,10-methylenetetrahydromethanopterin reductase